MRAGSLLLYRHGPRWPLYLVAAATFLIGAAVLFVALLAGAAGELAPEPVLTAPFRWLMETAAA